MLLDFLLQLEAVAHFQLTRQRLGWQREFAVRRAGCRCKHESLSISDQITAIGTHLDRLTHPRASPASRTLAASRSARLNWKPCAVPRWTAAKARSPVFWKPRAKRRREIAKNDWKFSLTAFLCQHALEEQWDQSHAPTCFLVLKEQETDEGYKEASCNNGRFLKKMSGYRALVFFPTNSPHPKQKYFWMKSNERYYVSHLRILSQNNEPWLSTRHKSKISRRVDHCTIQHKSLKQTEGIVHGTKLLTSCTVQIRWSEMSKKRSMRVETLTGFDVDGNWFLRSGPLTHGSADVFAKRRHFVKVTVILVPLDHPL